MRRVNFGCFWSILGKNRKILFCAQTGGPSGFVMKCKSDGGEVLCGILVFKQLGLSFLAVKGQNFACYIILKPAALARALAQRPLLLLLTT